MQPTACRSIAGAGLGGEAFSGCTRCEMRGTHPACTAITHPIPQCTPLAAARRPPPACFAHAHAHACLPPVCRPGREPLDCALPSSTPSLPCRRPSLRPACLVPSLQQNPSAACETHTLYNVSRAGAASRPTPAPAHSISSDSAVRRPSLVTARLHQRPCKTSAGHPPARCPSPRRLDSSLNTVDRPLDP